MVLQHSEELSGGHETADAFASHGLDDLALSLCHHQLVHAVRSSGFRCGAARAAHTVEAGGQAVLEVGLPAEEEVLSGRQLPLV